MVLTDQRRLGVDEMDGGSGPMAQTAVNIWRRWLKAGPPMERKGSPGADRGGGSGEPVGPMDRAAATPAAGAG